MKLSTRDALIDLCEEAINEYTHAEFNGRSESQYKSFREINDRYIAVYTECIQELRAVPTVLSPDGQLLAAAIANWGNKGKKLC